jgi:hypothetical protein
VKEGGLFQGGSGDAASADQSRFILCQKAIGFGNTGLRKVPFRLEHHNYRLRNAFIRLRESGESPDYRVSRISADQKSMAVAPKILGRRACLSRTLHVIWRISAHVRVCYIV